MSDLEQTVEKAELHEGQHIFVVKSEGFGGEPIKWRRFKNYHTSDYFCLEVNYKDAVIFIPKRDVLFIGFGVFSSYYGKDLKIKLGWEIDGDRTDMFDVTFIDADKSSDKIFDFYLKDVGEKPIKVKEGTEIHLIMEAVESDYEQRSTFYGYYGDPRHIENLEQE